MTMDPEIWLFDVDGVLVRPGGYREAVRATVNHFTRRMGLGDLGPQDEVMGIFESQGITCEWDMVPILLAMILETVCAQSQEPFHLDSLHDAQVRLPEMRMQDLPVSFEGVSRLRAYTRPGHAPAETLLEACEQGGGGGFFPHLAGQGVLRELLTNTRSPGKSHTTSVFETFVLGSGLFRAGMCLQCEVESESFLERFDRPLLDAETRAGLIAAWEKGDVRMAAYTARSSMPGGTPKERLATFAPEAEAALCLVGLEMIPLIGSGQVSQAALELGEAAERLTKPSPYHALAAVAAACLGSPAAAMQWTRDVFCFFERGGPHPALGLDGVPLPDPLTLRVFEDAPSGMRGAVRAVEILEALGVQASVKLYGIATQPEKVRALEECGASIFADINQAYRKAVID